MKNSERPVAEGALFTDQYQLTMAQLYFRTGMHENEAQFDHFFRSYPDYGKHQAGYCINAGLEWLIDWMRESRFRPADIEYLRGMKSRAGARLFHDDFLYWLRENAGFQDLAIRAIPEGRVVHPNVPLTVVQGPLAAAQILESSLLNHLNFQILVATKAARIREAARGQLLMEFGMRRAHEMGANAGARAALIGGADFTSNAGISHVLGLPPKGTHAHSMVQAFLAMGGSELDSFKAYAEIYPDDCLLLVDTIDTLGSGIPNAIRVFEELRRKGHEPVGIRLDSGDLSYLSIQAARMLDQAGFADTVIVLSNELDELIIWQVVSQIHQEAPRYGLDSDRVIGRLAYGVGTKLITSEGSSSLSGVYKLVALKDSHGAWRPAIKISETPEKSLNPGNKLAWRLYDKRKRAIADFMSLEDESPQFKDGISLHHPTDHAKHRTMKRDEILEVEPLLVDIFRDAKLVYSFPGIDQIRRQRQADVDRLDPGVKRLINPHIYHVSLTPALWNMKEDLIHRMRGA